MRNLFISASVRLLVALAALVSIAAPSAVLAAYPDKPIKIVVPFPAGGAADLLARAYADHLAKKTKQAVVVDNRTGGSGRIGAQVVARSPADGYTLLFTHTGLVQSLMLPGEPLYQLKDFEPIIEFSQSPIALAVPTTLGVSTFKEYAELVRSKPGVHSYGSAGTGQTVHFYGELLRQKAGLDIQHVPYRGEVPFLTDLIAGHVTSGFATIASLRPHIEAGKLKPLAVPGVQRSALLPDVPTLRELGFSGFEAVGWFGMLAPAGTPKAIVDQLNAAANELLAEPQTFQKLKDLALTPIGGTPEAYGKTITISAAQWAAIIKASGIKLE